MNIIKTKYSTLMLVVLLTLLASGTKAQNGFNQPYSQYGLGLAGLPYNTPSVAAMGGITLTRAFSNQLNPFNPASYAAIEKESFVFDMGMAIEMATLRDTTHSLYDADGNIGYLYFGMPLTWWWKTAFGVMPYTDVNYESVQLLSGTVGGDVKTVYEGTGSVTQFFWGHGFNVVGGKDATKAALRAGLNINFLYGNLYRMLTYRFMGNDTTYMMNSRRQKETYVRNLTFDLGLQYDQPLGEKYTLNAGLTLTPHRKMNVRDNALVYTFIDINDYQYSIYDTVFPADGNCEYTSSLEQPTTLGLGLALRRNGKWQVAADFNLAPWYGIKYTENIDFDLFGASPLRYDNFYRMALGFELTGDKGAAKYMRRVSYTAGFHWEQGVLTLQTHDGTDWTLGQWGVGAGMALPMRKGRSVLNLAIQYSQFGTSELLRRDALTIGVSIGSCESWFVKRKYN